MENAEKNSLVITKLTPDDWQVLRDIKLKSLDEEPIAFEDVEDGKKKYLDRTEDEWRARLNPEIKDKTWLFAQDTDTGKYIGAIFSHVSGGIATLQHVYVDKDHRGRGIGKNLLVSIIEKLKTRGGITDVEIQVLTTQEAAINLYHSLGFKDVRTVPGAAKRGEKMYDEIEMELSLNS